MSFKKVDELVDDFIPSEQWDNNALYESITEMIKDALTRLSEEDELTPENLKDLLDDLIRETVWLEDADEIVAYYGIYNAVEAYNSALDEVRGLGGYSCLTVEKMAYAVLYVSIPPVDEIIKAFMEED